MLGEQQRVGLAARLEPRAGEPVAQGAILLREHRVGPLAEQRVAEGVLLLARKAAVRPADEHRLVDQVHEPAGDLGARRLPAEQRGDAPVPEHLAEEARGPEHPARVEIEALEARPDHRHDGLRQRAPRGAAGAGRGPDQLLEVERVALGLIHDARDGGVVDEAAEQLAREPLGGPARQGPEVHHVCAPLGPQVGEGLVDLRPREGQHEEGRLVGGAERGVHEAHGGRVAPVQILEEEQDRTLGARGADQILEGALHLLGHEERVAARGPERVAVVVGQRGADELADELGDTPPVGGRDDPIHPGAEPVPALVERLAAEHADGAAQGLAEQAERGAVAERVPPADPHRERLAPPLQGAEELLRQARFPGPGRRDRDERLRLPLRDALGEGLLEARELALPADAGRGLAEEQPRGVRVLRLAPELRPRVAVAHVEARVEQRGGHLVDGDGGEPRPRELPRRAVDCVAQGEPARDIVDAAGDGDGPLAGDGPQREGQARGARRPILGDAAVAERDGDGLVGEQLEPAAGRRGRAAELRDGLVGVAAGDERRSLRAHRTGAPADQHHGHQAALGGPERPRQRRGVAARRVRPGDRLHLGEQVRAVAGPREGVLREHPAHERVEGGRHVGAHLPEPRRFVEDELGEQRHRVVGLERRPPGQRLVEHGAEREDVDRRREVRVSAGLLRRHVPRRAEQRPGLRHAGERPEPGDAEVDELHPADGAADEEEVARLDVAVNGAAAVELGERAGHTPREGQRLVGVEPPPPEERGEILAVEPLHGEVERALLGLSVCDVAYDRGVIEIGEGAGFPLEPVEVFDRVAAQDLERDRGISGVVEGLEDLAHPSRAGAPSKKEATADSIPETHDEQNTDPGRARATVLSSTGREPRR
ncbi:uncharacterized protein SOCE26_004040 [Sorangium cellulosum]|uniref:Uncharacterized protein n=1 Tax=Sorangium cellulosum TaxID=56 RepID=A0A2L0EI99_SORCE|nr:uncharacterized protein SOCE26_004040 [Sorangium cellulosum]